MTDRPWEQFLTEQDRAVFKAAGYRQPMGFGKRPAVLVVDVTYDFCGDQPEPILDSIKRWPNSCGEAAWRAMPHIRSLVDAARKRGAPVIYSRNGYRSDGWDFGSWRWKAGRIDESRPMDERTLAAKPNIDGSAIVADIAPGPKDIVVNKLKPSAFHGTPLTDHLTLLGVDSLIICGVSTSGCVRATVIDAFSSNYRIALAVDACFDRSEVSHAINLMDMEAKYADLLPSADIIAFLATVPQGSYDLPEGL